MALKPYTTDLGQMVLVQRKPGLRRLSLRFCQRRATFLASVPLFCSLHEIRTFIEGSKAWLSKIIDQQHSSQALQKILIEPGQTIRLLGHLVTMVFIEDCKSHVILNDNILEVRGTRTKFRRDVMLYFRNLAQEKFKEYSHLHAQKLGVTIGKISIKDMRSRYGSCTSRGDLNYCWRVVFAPELVLSYLCAHEVAHLKEMNHSKAFWHHVKNLCPDYLRHRQWLKQYGRELFAVI